MPENFVFRASTLVAPQWVLGAAQIEAESEVEQVFIHTRFQDTFTAGENGDLVNDFAMVELRRTGVGVTPIPLLCVLDTSRAQAATLVFYGADFTGGRTDSGAGTQRRTKVTFEVFRQQNMQSTNRGTTACRGDSALDSVEGTNPYADWD